jgi:hypothetical protein
VPGHTLQELTRLAGNAGRKIFKPEPAKVQFIKGKNKPFIYTQRINKGFLLALAELFKKLIK